MKPQGYQKESPVNLWDQGEVASARRAVPALDETDSMVATWFVGLCDSHEMLRQWRDEAETQLAAMKAEVASIYDDMQWMNGTVWPSSAEQKLWLSVFERMQKLVQEQEQP